jgi:hypothetical protein
MAPAAPLLAQVERDHRPGEPSPNTGTTAADRTSSRPEWGRHMIRERTSVSSTARTIAARSERMIQIALGTGTSPSPPVRPRVWVALALVASIAVLMLAGCGKSQDVGTVAGSAASPGDYVSQSVESASPMPLPGGAGSGPSGEGRAALPADSLAPDLVVSTSDTLGLPGKSVDLTARTSPDVVGVTLWDGLGQKQAFVYDSTADLWRASFRVPLAASHERLGLAVTAGNHTGKWRRVWVFLKTTPEAPKAEMTPPPGS